MDTSLTLQHIYIYIYIYTFICTNIDAVKLLTGPSLGVFKVLNWAKSKLLTGPRSFSHYKIGISGGFFLLSYHCVSFCFQLSGNFLKIAFFKKREQKLGFSILCALSLTFENSLF